MGSRPCGILGSTQRHEPLRDIENKIAGKSLYKLVSFSNAQQKQPIDRNIENPPNRRNKK
jgi:hypothetical protein